MDNTKTTTSTIYVNVFSDRFDNLMQDADAFAREADAIEHAQDFSDRYLYTLTDNGKVDLTPKFSASWHEQRRADLWDSQIQDARIADLKSFTMQERA